MQTWLETSHDAMGAELCKMADFSELPVKNELFQLVLKDFFTTNLIL